MCRKHTLRAGRGNKNKTNLLGKEKANSIHVYTSVNTDKAKEEKMEKHLILTSSISPDTPLLLNTTLLKYTTHKILKMIISYKKIPLTTSSLYDEHFSHNVYITLNFMDQNNSLD